MVALDSETVNGVYSLITGPSYVCSSLSDLPGASLSYADFSVTVRWGSAQYITSCIYNITVAAEFKASCFVAIHGHQGSIRALA